MRVHSRPRIARSRLEPTPSGGQLRRFALGAAVGLSVIAGGSTTAAASPEAEVDGTGDLEDAAEYQDRFGSAAVVGDFDGDGVDDLAVGVPYEDLGPTGEITEAGGVNVVYGTSKRGLSTKKRADQFWTQDTPGIDTIGANGVERAEVGDQFGKALAAGDFNGDGYDDLAISAPYEDIGDIPDAGQVNVIYGSDQGLSADRARADQVWDQDKSGVLGTSGAEDEFGRYLATGDFDGDGKDDLVVSVPSEDVNGYTEAGAANLLYGSTGGLSASGNQYWHQDSVDVDDDAYYNEYFGQGTTAADFDGDGTDDLAVAAPGQTVGSVSYAGVVHVVYGSLGVGLVASEDHPDQLWSQNSPDVEDVSESYDYFGDASLTAGDFNADGYADLVIGTYRDDVGDAADAGVVNVIYGSSAPVGLSATETELNQIWYQNDAAGLPDEPEYDDRFGGYITAGDFNGDSADDLAIGASGEDIGAISNAGVVNVIYGEPGEGLTLTGRSSGGWLHQGLPGMRDAAESADLFSSGAIVAGDFNGSGTWDLAVGVEYENMTDGPTDAGAIQVVYGKARKGLVAKGDQRNQLWGQGLD